MGEGEELVLKPILHGVVCKKMPTLCRAGGKEIDPHSGIDDEAVHEANAGFLWRTSRRPEDHP
jgi:hypothetical protein